MQTKPNRKSIRLKGYDYSQSGMYFITICCQRHRHLFGEIKHSKMFLNEYGQIAHNEWMNLPKRYPHIELGAFCTMPNHIHGIIIILPVGLGFTFARNDHANETILPHNDGNHTIRDDRDWTTARVAPTTIGNIVGAYKSLVTNGCLEIYKSKNETMGKLWQRNYYEHIIRNTESYQRITNYIHNNPIKWNKDCFYL